MSTARFTSAVLQPALWMSTLGRNHDAREHDNPKRNASSTFRVDDAGLKDAFVY